MTAASGRVRRAALRDLTRSALRHRALLAAGLAAAAVATALPLLSPRPAATSVVVTASEDLGPDRPLATSDLKLRSVATAAVPEGAVTDLEQALGRTLSGRVRRGETLTDVRLLGAGLVRRAGIVAAPVRLADPAVAALLRVGDHVDVLAADTDRTADASPGPPGEAAPAAPVADTVAAGVEVLSVPPADASGDGALVVLAVTPQTAARLAAAAVSSRLSVTVLPA